MQHVFINKPIGVFHEWGDTNFFITTFANIHTTKKMTLTVSGLTLSGNSINMAAFTAFPDAVWEITLIPFHKKTNKKKTSLF